MSAEERRLDAVERTLATVQRDLQQLTTLVRAVTTGGAPLEEEDPAGVIRWRCTGCGLIVGKIYSQMKPDKTTEQRLSIKHKSFGVNVYGGTTEVICPRCNLPNTASFEDGEGPNG